MKIQLSFALLGILAFAASSYAESPSDVLVAAYMAANQYGTSKVYEYMPSQAEAKLKEQPQAAEMFRQGWLEITHNGRIQNITIVKERTEEGLKKIDFQILYRDGSTKAYTDAVSEESGKWKISGLPVLEYIASVGIMATLAEVVGKHKIEENKQKRTMLQMIFYSTEVGFYFIDHNRYPAGSGSIQDLMKVLPPDRAKRLSSLDAWGNEFSYQTDPSGTRFWLISYGSDGKPDAGIYDSNGVPTQNAAATIVEPSNDVIYSGEDFIRKPAKKPDASAQASLTDARKTMKPNEIIQKAYQAAANYQFPEANGYLAAGTRSSFEDTLGKDFGAYIIKQGWQAMTKDGTLDHIEFVQEEGTSNIRLIRIKLYFKSGTTDDRYTVASFENGSWYIEPIALVQTLSAGMSKLTEEQIAAKYRALLASQTKSEPSAISATPVAPAKAPDGLLITDSTVSSVMISPTGNVAVITGSDGKARFMMEGDRMTDGSIKRVDPDKVVFSQEVNGETKDIVKKVQPKSN